MSETTNTPDVEETNKPDTEVQEPEKKEEGDKKAEPEKTGEDTEALKKELASTKSQLETLKKANADEAEKKRQESLTAEQKYAEEKQAREKAERELTIMQVRVNNGFTAKVFDTVVAKGNTAEEIKSSFDAFKANLDEYTATNSTQKPAVGKPSGEGKPSTPKGNEGTRVPILVKAGLVAGKEAV